MSVKAAESLSLLISICSWTHLSRKPKVETQSRDFATHDLGILGLLASHNISQIKIPGDPRDPDLHQK